MCRVSTLAMLAVTAVAPPVPAHAQTVLPEPRSVIVTVGEGVVRAAPDRAFVDLTTEARAASSAQAQRLNAETMTAVQQRLREMGLTGDAVRTLAVDLQPQFEYRENRQVLKGYLARNTIEVRIDDLTRIGEVLDKTVDAGVTSLGGVRFDLRNRSTLEREALRQAVIDAKARAEAAASGAGTAIERILRIEEQRGLYPMPPPSPVMSMRAAAQVPETPISTGPIEVRATVTLTVAIR